MASYSRLRRYRRQSRKRGILDINIITWIYNITEHGLYVAICDELKQTVQALNFIELTETINEVTDSTIRMYIEDDKLNLFIKNYNDWQTIIKNLPPKDKLDNVYFDIPVNIIKGRGKSFHAEING